MYNCRFCRCKNLHFFCSFVTQAAYFKILEHDMFPMSWGSATVYISQKTTAPFGDPNAVDDNSSNSSKSQGGDGGGGNA